MSKSRKRHLQLSRTAAKQRTGVLADGTIGREITTTRDLGDSPAHFRTVHTLEATSVRQQHAMYKKALCLHQDGLVPRGRGREGFGVEAND